MVCKLHLHKAIKNKQRGAELLAQLCPKSDVPNCSPPLSGRGMPLPLLSTMPITFLDPVYSQRPLFPPSSPLAASFYAKFLQRTIYHRKGHFVTSSPTTAPVGLPSPP